MFPKVIRRNSLPPLSRTDGKVSSLIPGLTDTKITCDKNVLPSITKDEDLRLSLPGPFGNQRPQISDVLHQYDFDDDEEEAINVIEPGLEEAEGITQYETAGFKHINEKSKFVQSVDPTEIITLQNLNLCGDERLHRQDTKISPRTITSRLSTPEILKLPQQGFDLTMKGKKAKCLVRPVVSQPMSSRSILATRAQNRNKVAPRRRPAPDNMASMEERLARNAKNNCVNRPKSVRQTTVKHKRLKRAKTAGARSRRNVCLLTCVKPKNLEEEKKRFMKSRYVYNPQFQYEYPASEHVLAKYNKASVKYLPQAMAIMNRVLERYGNYEKYEWATGGQLLSKTQLWNMVRRYLEKEGFFGEVVVNISNDLIARAAMTVNGGRPTLSIRESAAKRLWVEGLLRHEIGTHHLRFHNNRQQIWHNTKVRRQMGLKPANPTEEGLASLHSVLLRKDPSLWRSAILYYTIVQASKMSFCELFHDLGQFMEDPDVRWDYCLRSKRGQYDTSKPGCFCKDQVYLTGIIQLLQLRETLDFHLLCTMGKVSHEDLEMLKPHYNSERTKIPGFMEDLSAYRARLQHIVDVNGLEEWLDPPKEDEDADKV